MESSNKLLQRAINFLGRVTRSTTLDRDNLLLLRKATVAMTYYSDEVLLVVSGKKVFAFSAEPLSVDGCIAGWNIYAKSVVSAAANAGLLPKECGQAFRRYFDSADSKMQRESQLSRLTRDAGQLGYALIKMEKK